MLIEVGNVFDIKMDSNEHSSCAKKCFWFSTQILDEWVLGCNVWSQNSLHNLNSVIVTQWGWKPCPILHPSPFLCGWLHPDWLDKKTALTGFERLEWPRDHISPEDFFPLTRMDIVQMLCWVFSVPYYFLWRWQYSPELDMS